MTASQPRDVSRSSTARVEPITYVDVDPLIPTHLGTSAPHVHHRGSDRCLRNVGGEVCLSGEALRARVAELEAEVDHWKHHAWEAGEGFKRAIEDFNRANARVGEFRRENERLRAGGSMERANEFLRRAESAEAERDALRQEVEKAREESAYRKAAADALRAKHEGGSGAFWAEWHRDHCAAAEATFDLQQRIDAVKALANRWEREAVLMAEHFKRSGTIVEAATEVGFRASAQELLAALDVSPVSSQPAPEHGTAPAYRPEAKGEGGGSQLGNSQCSAGRHNPSFSRSECGACGDQESWCSTCSAQLCGCAQPAPETQPTNEAEERP